MLHTNPFDIILLDLNLIECRGLETVRTIRAEAPHLPIIVLTGLDDDQAAIEAIEQGADDYISKNNMEPELLNRSIRYSIQRKQSEQALAHRDAQLLQAQKLEAIGAMAGGIAHEFNNLLQAISGFTKFAIAGLSPQEKRFQDLQVVLNAADRATALTRQLLSFSRRHVLQRTCIDPNQVVTDLTKLLRPLIGESITVDTRLAPSLESISVDAGLLQQALLNLCINARDAMPRGGRLTIATEKVFLTNEFITERPHAHTSPHVMYTISDTGDGMPPEVKARIFEPFFTTKDPGKGTGLGLSMVYGMVEQHEGIIQVDSTPNVGTTFRISIPLRTTNESQPLTQPQATSRRGTETILIAEDESLVRGFMEHVLRSTGYRVIVANDGVEAVEMFRKHAADISLVLLDFVMPGLKGHEVYDRITRLRPSVRVVFCTGHDPTASQLPETADFVFLQKPFEASVLLQTVRSTLDNAQSATTPSELPSKDPFGAALPIPEVNPLLSAVAAGSVASAG